MRTLSPMDLRAGTCSEFIFTTIFGTAFYGTCILPLHIKLIIPYTL